MSAAAATPGRGRAPHLGLFVTEPARGLLDLGALVAGVGPLLLSAPRGDGHPVLVLPGLLGTDSSTVPLRRFLRRQGYHVHGWRLGRNIGPTREIVEGLRDRLTALAGRHGRPISLIGWSLGGIYAREMARAAPPEVIRQVITLGSPYRLTHPHQSRAHRTFQRFSHRHIDQSQLPLPEDGRPPLTVLATSVYSRLDGIVAWQACIDTAGPRRENIQVLASHLGLGHHPAVLWAIADRLAQPPGEWRPFRPPLVARHLYPRADIV